MTSPPWKPLRLSIDLDRQIESTFAELIHKTWGAVSRRDAWQPEVDIYETENDYVIEADLPGVRSADLRIDADEHRISISGSRQSTGVAQSAHGVRLERWQGRFERTFYVEQPVDPATLQHECAEGTHIIRVSKRRQG